jgi:hypothetical protein
MDCEDHHHANHDEHIHLDKQKTQDDRKEDVVMKSRSLAMIEVGERRGHHEGREGGAPEDVRERDGGGGEARKCRRW